MPHWTRASDAICPDTVYSQATTLGELAAAVQKHLIDHPHSDVSARAVPAENYEVARFPEYLELKRHKRMLLAVTETNPYFMWTRETTRRRKACPDSLTSTAGR